MEKTCIIIAGPTASGKTDLSLELARHFSTEIISADSRQCYRELNIAVAKPSPQELDEIHRHFINCYSVTDAVTAADFVRCAEDAVKSILSKNDVAIITGGTGLYIRAFTDGLDPVPAPAPGIREMLTEKYSKGGIEWLQQKIRELDPLFAEKGEMMNPRRIMRALEVIMTTGNSVLTYFSSPSVKKDYRVINSALDIERQQLYERINRRVDKMMETGLTEEARGLLPFRDYPALKTVGYAELFDFFDGKCSLERAVELIKQHTRQYAKRQLTWFRNDGSFIFCKPRLDEVLSLL